MKYHLSLLVLLFYSFLPFAFASFTIQWIDGEGINTIYHDGTPFVTPDGLTMYFSSNRIEGLGLHDIYRATFSEGNWGNVINLATINSSGNDSAPWVFGNYLYFSTDRWVGHYQLARATLNGGVWGSVEPLPGFDQTGVNAGCSISSDGNTMYFASTRAPSQGNFDIFTATNMGGYWGNITSLGTPIDSREYEAMPDISPNGNILHFCKSVTGTWYLFYSIRNGSSWGIPIECPEPINIPGGWQNQTPCYRPELNKLFFVTDRPPSLGGHDIWVANSYNVGVEPTSLGQIKASFR